MTTDAETIYRKEMRFLWRHNNDRDLLRKAVSAIEAVERNMTIEGQSIFDETVKLLNEESDKQDAILETYLSGADLETIL